ncbi:MAG: aminoglycoside phosphotransferase family protein [Methyloligellaceae bacterium]
MSETWRIDEADPAALDFIASALALIVRTGDLITLTGGQSTSFGDALVGHIRGTPEADILSRDSANVQILETSRLRITRFGFRTAGAQEVGLADALAQGLALVEQGEHGSQALPADALEIETGEPDDDGTVRFELRGHGAWSGRLARLRAMAAFLKRATSGRPRLGYLQGDASTRAYARVRTQDRACILMDSPRQPDGPVIRDGKPYSAIAHLAEDVRPFVAVATALRAAGLSAPEVLAHDLDDGFLLIEDLGDRVYGAEVAARDDLSEIYRVAVDALVTLRGAGAPERLELPGGAYGLPAYDDAALMIEVDLLLDWFWPAAHGTEASEPARAEFRSLWRQQFDFLAGQPVGWVLRDYHSPNLIWLPEREGVARAGIIDFQDALSGPHAYDLVSLLQDARLDVPAAVERTLFAHYCAACERIDPTFDRTEFSRAYAVLGAQRNTKILGIFVRLAKRDGKTGYLAHLPRVAAYLERNLAHPDLVALRRWYDNHLPPETRREPQAL